MFLYNIRVRKLESDNCVTCSGNVALVSLHLGGVHCPSFYWTLVIHLCSGAVCENGVLRTMTATYLPAYSSDYMPLLFCLLRNPN